MSDSTSGEWRTPADHWKAPQARDRNGRGPVVVSTSSTSGEKRSTGGKKRSTGGKKHSTGGKKRRDELASTHHGKTFSSEPKAPPAPVAAKFVVQPLNETLSTFTLPALFSGWLEMP